MAETTIPIGILHVQYFDESSARGALMVMDQDTIPLEFLVTEHVEPTKVQSLLYGPALQKAISIKIISLPLLQHVKNKMVILLVKDKNLLELRPQVEIPVVCIAASSEGIVVNEANREIKPVSIVTHPRFQKDAEIAERVMPRIQKVTSPYEPFERVEIAIRAAQRSNLKKEEGNG